MNSCFYKKLFMVGIIGRMCYNRRYPQNMFVYKLDSILNNYNHYIKYHEDEFPDFIRCAKGFKAHPASVILYLRWSESHAIKTPLAHWFKPYGKKHCDILMNELIMLWPKQFS